MTELLTVMFALKEVGKTGVLRHLMLFLGPLRTSRSTRESGRVGDLLINVFCPQANLVLKFRAIKRVK